MDVVFKIPQESADYRECSDFVVKHIKAIMRAATEGGRNRIFIRTNFKRGLPASESSQLHLLASDK